VDDIAIMSTYLPFCLSFLEKKVHSVILLLHTTIESSCIYIFSDIILSIPEELEKKKRSNIYKFFCKNAPHV